MRRARLLRHAFAAFVAAAADMRARVRLHRAAELWRCRDLGFAFRGTFLIDADGIVRFAEHNGPGDARNQQGWKDAIEELKTAA